MGLALLAMRAVTVIRPGHVDGRSVAAALAGAAVFAVYSYVSVNAVIAIASGRSHLEMARDGVLPSLVCDARQK